MILNSKTLSLSSNNILFHILENSLTSKVRSIFIYINFYCYLKFLFDSILFQEFCQVVK